MTTEERIREILGKTNHVFAFYDSHGMRYEGGDLTPEIMAVIVSERLAGYEEGMRKGAERMVVHLPDEEQMAGQASQRYFGYQDGFEAGSRAFHDAAVEHMDPKDDLVHFDITNVDTLGGLLIAVLAGKGGE